MIDYLRLAQEYHGSRNDGFLTDVPISTKLAEDDIVKVRYDAKAMRWIPNHKTLRRWCTQTFTD